MTAGLCACQWGICGACDGTSDRGRPRHDHCLSRQHGAPVVYPVAWLTYRGMVVGPPLWPASGAPCRYICSCLCPKAGPVAAPPRSVVRPPQPAPVDALFALEDS